MVVIPRTRLGEVIMDRRTAEELERRLAQRARDRGEAGEAAPTAGKSLYVEDLEERARRLGTTVDEVYAADQEALSQAQPTPECLHADLVMLCARDEQKLPHDAYEHYQGCAWCRSVVAQARPDVARYQQLVGQLAELEDDPEADPAVVRRADAFFSGLDRGVRRTVEVGGKAAAVVFFLVLGFLLLPQGLRDRLPLAAWTNSQLEQNALKALHRGDTSRAESLASLLIERQPDEVSGYLLRSRALLLAGKEGPARADLRMAGGLLGPDTAARWSALPLTPQEARQQVREMARLFGWAHGLAGRPPARDWQMTSEITAPSDLPEEDSAVAGGDGPADLPGEAITDTQIASANRMAAALLRRLATEKPTLRELVNDSDEEVRRGAATALAVLGRSDD
jgi:hypothetical protein